MRLVTIALATLGMGVAVTISWMMIGLRSDYVGLDPVALTSPARLAIYGIQFALVGGFGYVLARTRLRREPMRSTAAVMAAGWVGEGIVLTAIGGLIANELNPFNAWWFWLVATAGPIQPLVGLLGAWLGRRGFIALDHLSLPPRADR